MRYNVSVDYTQQKFYIYDGQKGEWKPHDLLNEHPQYQIFMRIWGAQHKTIDTADNGQMTAPLLPLQNPTLISGEHGYRSNKEEISEPFAVTSKSKETEERWDEEIPWFIKGCKGLETESKPVIYLYPEAETEVTVRLEYKGRLTCTYPAPDPDCTWRVTARPDGTLTDRQGREYSYLPRRRQAAIAFRP